MPRIKRYLDAIDLEILKALSKNCKSSLGEIAKYVGISIPMIRKRIRTLERIGILKGCRAVILTEILSGVKVAIIVITGIDPEIISKKIRSELEGVENIYISKKALSTIIMVRTLDSKLENYLNNLKAEYDSIDIKIYEIDSIEYPESWIPNKPGIEIVYRCIYCGGVIMGSPYIVEKDSIILTFHGKECAKAYGIK